MTTPAIAEPLISFTFPISLSAIQDEISRLAQKHGNEVVIRQYGTHIVAFTEGEMCSCSECQDRIDEVIGSLYPMRGMIVCTTCGNKRCPHAKSHRYACTGSNEAGQVAVPIPLRDER